MKKFISLLCAVLLIIAVMFVGLLFANGPPLVSLSGVNLTVVPPLPAPTMAVDTLLAVGAAFGITLILAALTNRHRFARFLFIIRTTVIQSAAKFIAGMNRMWRGWGLPLQTDKFAA